MCFEVLCHSRQFARFLSALCASHTSQISLSCLSDKNYNLSSLLTSFAMLSGILASANMHSLYFTIGFQPIGCTIVIPDLAALDTTWLKAPMLASFSARMFQRGNLNPEGGKRPNPEGEEIRGVEPRRPFVICDDVRKHPNCGDIVAKNPWFRKKMKNLISH